MSGGGEEQGNMDKKFCRQSPAPPKGNGVECKKDNSNVGGQKAPRNRRKEQGGRAGGYDQQSSYRRPQPQKSRALDKRPRSRGLHNGSHTDEVTQEEGAEADYGSVQAWGSKKTNLAHLLNFHLVPRESYGRGRGGAGAYRGPGRNKKSSYNKEHFLQANCQFVVSAAGDYTAHTVDPDTVVDWDHIEQVRILGHEVPSCPICLYAPTAAKITRCGHIYCWACMLHYLSLGDKSWRKCPICYDAVHKKDLKSVVALKTHTYQVGQKITLKKMKRIKGSNMAMPVSQWSDRGGKLYNIHDDVDTCFVKLLMATPEQVQAMLSEEQSMLKVQQKEVGSETIERTFVDAAIELLKERQKSCVVSKPIIVEALQEQTTTSHEEEEKEEITLIAPEPTKVYTSAFSDEEQEEEDSKGEGAPPEPGLHRGGSWAGNKGPVAGKDPNLPKSRSFADIENKARSQTVSESSEVSLDGMSRLSESTDTANDIEEEVMFTMETDDAMAAADVVPMVTAEGKVEVPVEEVAEVLEVPREPQRRGQAPSNYFFSFQAADGQHIYLHSLNTRCLIREYGSLENAPDTITASIIELESITMTENLRGRIRYLGHLPLTCEFQVAELALTPPLVSREVLTQFADDIQKRKRLRQRKNREEKRFSQRIQEEEDKMLSLHTNVGYIIPSAQSQSGGGQAEAQLAKSVDSSSLDFTPVGTPSSDMAASPSDQAPTQDDDKGSFSFAQMLRAGKASGGAPGPVAWGRHGNTSTAARPGSPNSDGEGAGAPAFQHFIGDAIQDALDKFDKSEDKTCEQNAAPTGGKKKKKLKKLLFANTMNRS